MKKDNIPGLEGYYISRLGTLWSRYHKSGKLTHSEWHKVKPNSIIHYLPQQYLHIIYKIYIFV